MHTNVTELLAAWDSGESIWSMEMGGLGPGYEQAIQVAAVEFARVGKNFVPSGDNEKDAEAWDKICSDRLREIDTKDANLGLSGAMFGAASWLAWQWCHNGGPADLKERAKKHDPEGKRSIQVSKEWPKVIA